MRTILHCGFLLLIGSGLISSCAEKNTLQDKLKGMWVLESRTLPDGTQLTPPTISGRLDWFAMNADAGTAHVSVLTTYGDTDLQVYGSHYTIVDNAEFSQEIYLEVGGGVSKNHDKSYKSARETDAGTIDVEGTKITIKHNKGLVYVFDGAVLTIKHQDGTTDVLIK